jgi:hypothetical protein
MMSVNESVNERMKKYSAVFKSTAIRKHPGLTWDKLLRWDRDIK